MPASLPLVSIGLPIYRNRPVGLRRALESILAQTHSNFELHISDNASPYPEISAIGQEFAKRDNRITYHRQPTNLGLDNFKALTSLATKGDYFMWMADDDCWDPHFIEHNLALLAARPDAGLATTSVVTQNAQGEITYRMGDFSRYSHLNYGRPGNLLLNVLRYTAEAEVRGKANLLCGLYRREALNAAMAHWGPRQMERPFGDIVFLTALQARYAVVGSAFSMLRKGVPSEGKQWVVNEPCYQSFTFKQWPSYTRRLIAVMPTPFGKAAMALTMVLRLIHKVCIALPYKLVRVALRRAGLIA